MIKNNFFKSILRLFPETIDQLRKNSFLLEKKYAILKKKEEQNKNLYKQLRSLNIRLKKELKEKEDELRALYQQITLTEGKKQTDEIQKLEKKIAGGFAHKIKNLYQPLILYYDFIIRNDYLSKNRDILADICRVSQDWALPDEEKLQISTLRNRINTRQEKIRSIFDISRNAIQKNLTLINDFLNYSEFKSPGSLVRIDLNKVMDRVMEANQELLSRSRVRCRKDYAAEAVVAGTEEHFFIVFQNMVLNSINALEKKEPVQEDREIRIRSYPAADREKAWAVEIGDNGPGIPENNMNRIFTPFFTTRKQNGTGLGLALCRKIIEMYNGTISVKSEWGKGTVFTIILPEERRE
ncbi:MAG: HAMP domain-containing sensor histidine kinase [bacterium]|nr:HAMP domain-containing sensor histidine kinase [bacterium]